MVSYLCLIALWLKLQAAALPAAKGNGHFLTASNLPAPVEIAAAL